MTTEATTVSPDVGSAAAQFLLQSMTLFIREVVSTASPINSINSNTGLVVSGTAAPIYNSTVKENLIAAMISFIEESVRENTVVKSLAHDAITDSIADSNTVTDRTENLNEIVPIQRHKIKPAAHGLPPVMVQEVYRRVFNEMPIRLLSFDSTGGNLQLLERNMIAEYIMSRIPRDEVQALDEDDSDYEEESFDIVEHYSSYAILSHTWIRSSPGDVVFGDWSIRELNPRGNAKIIKFCEIAAVDHNVRLGWMDTVCINKESSSELDESIRSMYHWYERSAMCVVYLAETTTLERMQYDSWFTRGWTLQELLAPQHIRFYNKDWMDLASPEHTSPGILDFDSTLDDEIKRYLKVHEITFADGHRIEALDEIPMQIQHQINKVTSLTRSELLLCRLEDYAGLTLSRIMQLAARRKVTREEDRVYSLMGLLNVGIPVAYGEGEESAFARLIREFTTSKSAFTEIFNHGNKCQTIPTGLADFASRSTLFDDILFRLDSVLHYMVPIEPMVLTHIGMRMTLLLVPAFLKNRYESKVPSTTEPQTVAISYWMDGSTRDYILLNNGPSTAARIERLGLVDGNHICFIGVINFTRYSSHYTARSNWLCIPFQVPQSFKVDLLQNIDVVESNLLPISGPIAISRTEKNTVLTPGELRNLGMSIATVYAR